MKSSQYKCLQRTVNLLETQPTIKLKSSQYTRLKKSNEIITTVKYRLILVPGANVANSLTYLIAVALILTLENEDIL